MISVFRTWGHFVGVEDAGKVAVGKIVGFGQLWNPFSNKVKVIVKVDGFTVNAVVDSKQLDYFQKKFATDSPVAIAFYGGEWHLGSPPVQPQVDGTEADIDLLQREMDDFNLIELIGMPDKGLIAKWKKPEAWGKDDLKGLSDELDEYNEYLRRVEANIKDNGNEILDNIGLSHLAKDSQGRGKPQKKKGHNWASHLGDRLDTIIAQNNEILANQDELLRLMRKSIHYDRPHGRSKNKFN